MLKKLMIGTFITVAMAMSAMSAIAGQADNNLYAPDAKVVPAATYAERYVGTYSARDTGLYDPDRKVVAAATYTERYTGTYTPRNTGLYDPDRKVANY